MKLSMIACVGKNLELGKNNDLIWHLPNDLKYFKKVTDGHVVVMGKNTFKSLPKVLPNRKNIVLTFPDDTEKLPNEVEVFHGIEEFLESYKDYQDEVFIIGGASIYKQFLKYADNLYLTEVDMESEADVYFPEFDKSLYDKEIVLENSDNNIKYKHVIYRRK
ncbi:MAG: dihydrofolate reductase [Bacilli bacterium]|nr:dihydrofolate reductase [Bacilli bacterium]